MKSFLKNLKQFANLQAKPVQKIGFKKPTNDAEIKQLHNLIDHKKITFIDKQSKKIFEKYYSENVFKNLICDDKTNTQQNK